MGTIHNRRVPDDLLRTLRIRAATSDQSLQDGMLDEWRKQAGDTGTEELLARKRAEALIHGESHLDPQAIVELIRADRESR